MDPVDPRNDRNEAAIFEEQIAEITAERDLANIRIAQLTDELDAERVISQYYMNMNMNAQAGAINMQAPANVENGPAADENHGNQGNNVVVGSPGRDLAYMTGSMYEVLNVVNDIRNRMDNLPNANRAGIRAVLNVVRGLDQRVAGTAGTNSLLRSTRQAISESNQLLRNVTRERMAAAPPAPNALPPARNCVACRLAQGQIAQLTDSRARILGDLNMAINQNWRMRNVLQELENHSRLNRETYQRFAGYRRGVMVCLNDGTINGANVDEDVNTMVARFTALADCFSRYDAERRAPL